MPSANIASVVTHQRRMKRLIGALLATLAPLAVAEACGTDSGGSGSDGGVDATLDHATPDVATTPGDAANADVGMDAPSGYDANCVSNVTVHDAGMDGDAYADPYCTYDLSCGIMGVLRTSGCQVLSVNSTNSPPQPLGCWVVADGCDQDVYVPDANVTVQCMDCIGGGGRRPDGLRVSRARCRSKMPAPLGRYFAAMAFEERAAVLAFARMESELALHDAPRRLRTAARRATVDERRHAHILAGLARRHGAAVPRARLGKTKERSLQEIALENAAEGCVRETFGAALLAYQCAHATDPTVRAALRTIARDESRHAALSWALASWAETRLDPDEAARVQNARSLALAALREDIQRRKPSPHDARIGHPSRVVATALLDGLARELALT